MSEDLNQIITTIVVVLIILIIYYSSTWQRRKQEKELKKMQDDLKVGDKIITISGLTGVISEVLEDRVIVELHPDKNKVSIEKWAIAGLDVRTFDKKKRPTKAPKKKE